MATLNETHVTEHTTQITLDDTLTARLKYAVKSGTLAQDAPLIELEAHCRTADALERIATQLARH